MPIQAKQSRKSLATSSSAFAAPRRRRICAAWAGLWLIFSLASTFTACQTPKSQNAQEKGRALLDSQLMVVRGQLNEGKPEAALLSLRPIARNYPNNAAVENLLGLTHLALRNPARSIRHFTNAYKLDQTPATALNLSSALLEAGDFRKAIELLSGLAKSKEGQNYEHKERIFHNLGYAHARMGNNQLAGDWLRRATEENPTFFPSYLELARIYEKTKRPALAMKAYQQASDHCPNCFEPVQALSTLYVKANRAADAQRMLLRFTKEDGISPHDRREAQRLLRVVTATAAGGPAPRVPRRG